MKKALMFDLDNTIYPVSAIADTLFTDLFRLLDQNADEINKNGEDIVSKVKHEMTYRPFQKIAEQYRISDEITSQMLGLLKNLSYDQPMQPFEDYKAVAALPLEKFLVTTGFVKLQFSKVKQLGIERDFKEVFIVDPEASDKTKKDVFAEIMAKYHYSPEELLVIGDDPESELKAALELGIDTFLFDPANNHPGATVTHRSAKLTDILTILR